MIARDAELRAALAKLPGKAGRRTQGARQLVEYATSRAQAGRAVARIVRLSRFARALLTVGRAVTTIAVWLPARRPGPAAQAT